MILPLHSQVALKVTNTNVGHQQQRTRGIEVWL